MRAVAGALLLAAAAGPAAAQDLASLVRSAERDPIVFGFPARPGVCGAGDAILIREPDGSSMFLSGRMSRGDWRRWRDEDHPCEVGDVVVEAIRTGGTLTDVRVRVGRPDATAGVALLGLVTGQAAADYLLAAAETAAERDARALILASALAGDAVRWPGLLRLAKDRRLPSGTRKAAVHWLGREAAAETARELGGLVRDRTEADEIREAAVFAVSQLPREKAVDLLIDVVRTVPDARVRSRALFWLAEMDHPRAIALFEEILSRG
ncbi:MAG: hypothetical protein KY466_08360 [Gemmatimonadetes bacterium]|nr:hypothetical protein [Gemmatimonadota bacterium]